MGACNAKLVEEAAATARDAEFDRQIRLEHEQDHAKVKLLLLGAGESGKSTLFKQMRLLYGKGYSEDDKRQMLPVVFFNTLTSIQAMVAACAELKYPVEQRASIAVIKGLPDDTAITPEIATHISLLWKDPFVQRAYEERHLFQLNDSAKFFFDKVEQIAAPDYLPTEEDIIKTRVRTAGILEETYRINEVDFVVFDVGGQRNERRKWIHAFDDVSAIIFVASLSEYDQTLFEDNLVNRLVEALNLFEEMCNSKWFDNKSIILFLNKSDLFREKIKHTDLRQPNTNPFTAEKEPVLFADYTGGCNYDAALKYIVAKFLQRADGSGSAVYASAQTKRRQASPKKEVFWQVTCATDPANVDLVFNAAKEIILKHNLATSGFVV